VRQVTRSKGNPVPIEFKRGAERQTVSVVPRATHDPNQPWRIGIRFGEIVRPGFFAALGQSIRANERNATLILEALRGIAERRISPTALSGPIRIAKESGDAAKEGTASFLELMAAVSLNLAVFNLLPIPILDGGTLLMLIIEMLLQREVSMRVKENIFKVGFVFLMMVVVFVLYNDISHLITKS
jgi:regulator of sigma E protease